MDNITPRPTDPELWVKTEEAIAKEEGKRAADETMKKVRRWMKKRPAPREADE